MATVQFADVIFKWAFPAYDDVLSKSCRIPAQLSSDRLTFFDCNGNGNERGLLNTTFVLKSNFEEARDVVARRAENVLADVARLLGERTNFVRYNFGISSANKTKKKQIHYSTYKIQKRLWVKSEGKDKDHYGFPLQRSFLVILATFPEVYANGNTALWGGKSAKTAVIDIETFLQNRCFNVPPTFQHVKDGWNKSKGEVHFVYIFVSIDISQDADRPPAAEEDDDEEEEDEEEEEADAHNAHGGDGVDLSQDAGLPPAAVEDKEDDKEEADDRSADDGDGTSHSASSTDTSAFEFKDVDNALPK